jgi:hypothetical protein
MIYKYFTREVQFTELINIFFLHEIIEYLRCIKVIENDVQNCLNFYLQMGSHLFSTN